MAGEQGLEPLTYQNLVIDDTPLGYYYSLVKYDRSSTSHRLKIIAGQLEGLARMLDDGQYCVDVLRQSLAIQKALGGIDKVILKEHLSGCVVDQMKRGESDKAIEELVQIYSLSGKN